MKTVSNLMWLQVYTVCQCTIALKLTVIWTKAQTQHVVIAIFDAYAFTMQLSMKQGWTMEQLFQRQMKVLNFISVMVN